MLTSAVQVHAEATESIVGDVNGDGAVNVADVMLIVNHILGEDMTNYSFSVVAANINKDDQINVTDVMIVVGIILGYQWDDPDNPFIIIDEGDGKDPSEGV